MNILITGITGFVGRNLTVFLKNNNPDITIYGLDIVQVRQDGVDRIYLWNELSELPSVDVVIHLAGKAHDTKNQAVAADYFDVNLGLTQRIYDWSEKRKVDKFIFFSSIKAVVDSSDGQLISESVAPSPKGPYGESKLAAEDYLLQNFEKEMSIYILRPCMIHGPGNKGNLNLLYGVIRKGIPWPLGIYENKRSFCSIGNICFVVQELINREIERGIYNVCDDSSVSTNELVRLIADSLGKRSVIWYLPMSSIDRLAKIGDRLRLPLNSERLRKLTETYEVSNAKLKKVLGIASMPISAVEGLKQTLQAFRRN